MKELCAFERVELFPFIFFSFPFFPLSISFYFRFCFSFSHFSFFRFFLFSLFYLFSFLSLSLSFFPFTIPVPRPSPLSLVSPPVPTSPRSDLRSGAAALPRAWPFPLPPSPGSPGPEGKTSARPDPFGSAGPRGRETKGEACGSSAAGSDPRGFAAAFGTQHGDLGRKETERHSRATGRWNGTPGCRPRFGSFCARFMGAHRARLFGNRRGSR